MLAAQRRGRSGAARGAAGPERSLAATGTDESADLLGADDPALRSAEPDPDVLRRARRIAEGLSVRRPRAATRSRRGLGELRSHPFQGASDDIDLDATLEVLAGRPVPEDADVVVRERARTRRSVVLVVDVSGSMRGERVRTAAATIGALAGKLAQDDVAVIAFWSDAALLAPLGARMPPGVLLDRLLRLPARGLTNVAFPLQVAKRQLARVPARDARVLLLSDCVHNAGPDPRQAARSLPRLDVLLDRSGEHDSDLARELARLGRGRLAVVADHRAVAPALSRLFAD